jgi:hypothetical protein
MSNNNFGDPRSNGSYNVLQLDALSNVKASGPPSAALNCSTPFTVDAWVRFTGLPMQVQMLAQDGVFQFGTTGSGIYFLITGQGPVVSSSGAGALSDGHWHHICATFDGGMIRLYIDGVFNTGSSVVVGGPVSTSPILIGEGLEGLVRTVRVLSVALTAEQVVNSMFSAIAALGPVVVAWFDFSQVPPVDCGPSVYSLKLQQNAQMINLSPALTLGFQGFARPFGDHGVNPGGAQVDPYTVQAWIYLTPGSTQQQAIFVNSDLRSDSGMALYAIYDGSAGAYRLASQRGSDGDAGQVLTSKGTVPTGAWVNVATTFDGAALSLYLQGALDSPQQQCPPIPGFRLRSDLLIGAAIVDGIPAPGTALQGFIREVDVWSICLTEAQITQFMGQLPDPLEPGLQAAYNFTTSPARNQVNGHPIGLAEGAVLSGQLGPAVALAAELVDESAPGNRQDVELLAQLRASLNLKAFAESHAEALQTAMRADMDAVNGDADKKLIGDRWAEVMEKLHAGPDAMPAWISAHRMNGEDLLVSHRPGGSSIVFRAPVGTYDSCTLWKINLVFTVVAGVLDAVFGLTAKLTDAANAYIAGLLARPIITSAVAVPSISAVSVFNIVQMLYIDGALRPLIRMMLEIGFWALLRVLTRMVLVMTGLVSAQLLSSLAITVANLIYMMANRPSGCIALPTLTLSAIAFNYGPGAQALQIRKNRTISVAVPEWVPADVNAPDSPAAYLATAQATVAQIQVSFLLSSPTALPIQVQALGGGILGAIDPFTIPGSGTVTVTLTHNTLANGAVAVQNVQWNWQYQIGAGGWIALATTNHRIYSVLSTAQLPWSNVKIDLQSSPWTDVLDLSCVWAAGASNGDDALEHITDAVNSMVGLAYDTPGFGASHYVSQNNQFLCTEFLLFLSGQGGLGHLVNCTDCATIVTTFANAIGCDVSATLMYHNNAATTFFACNQIKSIGSPNWAYPFPAGNPPNVFSYHEVVSKGQPLIPTFYDACLRINEAGDPWTVPLVNPVAELPANIPYTAIAVQPQLPLVPPFDANSYRERLAQNSAAGIGACNLVGPRVNTNNGRRYFI